MAPALESSGSQHFVTQDHSTRDQSTGDVQGKKPTSASFAASQTLSSSTNLAATSSTNRLTTGSSSHTLRGSQSLGGSQSLRRHPRARCRPAAITDFRTTAEAEDEDDTIFGISPKARPRTHAGYSRPSALRMSGSLASLKASLTDPALVIPGTPLPDREEYRHIEEGVIIVFFDFDGTLTATPGDRAARCLKQAELCQRAPMLEPRLRALREAGVALGIISKSTEGTIRDALQAANLAAQFEAPVIGKAVSLEGKAGIIDELARNGALRKVGSRGLPPGQVVGSQVLLVDDDVLELERARNWGLQTYAAPSVGGLRDEDFDAITTAVRRPRKATSTVPGMNRSISQCTSFMSANRRAATGLSLGKPHGGKWRNLILFSGEAFDA